MKKFDKLYDPKILLRICSHKIASKSVNRQKLHDKIINHQTDITVSLTQSIVKFLNMPYNIYIKSIIR